MPFKSNRVSLANLTSSHHTYHANSSTNSRSNHRNLYLARDDHQHHQIKQRANSQHPQNSEELEEFVIDLFKSEGQLEEGKLKKTHEIVNSLLDSEIGIYVYDKLKTGVLPKAARIIKSKIDECNYIETLESVWNMFYKNILPNLECMLYKIQSESKVSIRKATIITFRDYILVNSPLEDQLKCQLKNKEKISDVIVHMILVVQSVFECFPPSKNKMKMERLAALAVTPYLGYRGLYLDHSTTPVVKSNEPEKQAKRKQTQSAIQLTMPKVAPDKASKSLTNTTQTIRPSRKSSHNLNYWMARIYK